MFDSIAHQTQAPEEVIFIDDGSNDGTSPRLRRLIDTGTPASSSTFKLLVNEHNEGQAAAISRGAAEATSELIMVLNDDDSLMHDAVETMRTLFARHPNIALIGGHAITSPPTSRRSGHARSQPS